MKIAIMQPYLFPYIGYFQLINAVDEFVIYDNIQFTKKGWINRNRILVNGDFAYITLPLKKDSDYLNIKDRFLADTWELDRKKILNRIVESYRNAPFFNDVFPLVELCIMHDDINLFDFIFNSIQLIINYLEINTKLIKSSTININHNLKSEEKVIALCNNQNASLYINPIGGLYLYNKENFRQNNLDLNFQRSNSFVYKQFKNEFIPWLSIIDVIMFNNREKCKLFLNNYELI
jgi:hypothetical protein